LRAACAVAIVGFALPHMRSPMLMPNEDFRSATFHAVQAFSPDTRFLYPWAPNRDFYRVYLDRMLGVDSRPLLAHVNESTDIPRACQSLAGVSHVAVVAAGASSTLIDEVYAACGSRWPVRFKQEYRNAFSEHWFADPPPIAPTR
jgi:hypothetical protein